MSSVRLALAGCGAGVLALGLVVGALSGLRALAWTGRGGLDLSSGLVWALYFILVAAAQEGVFRGWPLTVLARRTGFWRAAIITSLAFAAIHVFAPGRSALGLVAMAMFGLAMCAAVRRFGALWWAMGFHAGWDFMLTAAFGFGAGSGPRAIWRFAPHGPVWLSGGATGPEASLITVAILGCLGWALTPRAAETRR